MCAARARVAGTQPARSNVCNGSRCVGYKRCECQPQIDHSSAGCKDEPSMATCQSLGHERQRLAPFLAVLPHKGAALCSATLQDLLLREGQRRQWGWHISNHGHCMISSLRSLSGVCRKAVVNGLGDPQVLVSFPPRRQGQA